MSTRAIFRLVFPIFLSIILVIGCKDRTPQQEEAETKSTGQTDFLFPKGQKGPDKNFTGNAYNTGLLAPDSTYTTIVGNVFFEPGARSNWHTHPSGQILIITDGAGFHQIEGEAKQFIQKGDVIKCPPNTRHWHGATADSELQQMYIVPNTEKGIVNWMEPVTDAQYNAQ
ncbi:cupin domain-containing protein [Mesonia sp.]|uniref:cupin domain-containing protein n=1 Tax=Mesonia sp. TaxID=1960830 RepID=UPI001750F2E8|nr:cupin domain-containing protein [Mesonia sp.]HIB36021.1 cupin domain-containing protein [Mesonia sp.]HIO26304.1 cupin domain-containing protein [Flavobacteriaceae bacterium]